MPEELSQRRPLRVLGAHVRQARRGLLRRWRLVHALLRFQGLVLLEGLGHGRVPPRVPGQSELGLLCGAGSAADASAGAAAHAVA